MTKMFHKAHYYF